MTRSEFNTSLDLYHLKNDCHVICKYKDKRTCPYLLTCHKTTTTICKTKIEVMSPWEYMKQVSSCDMTTYVL